MTHKFKVGNVAVINDRFPNQKYHGKTVEIQKVHTDSYIAKVLGSRETITVWNYEIDPYPKITTSVDPAPEPMTKRESILREGLELTTSQRNVSYGPPTVNLTAAGEFKALFRKHLRREMTPGEMEAIDQVLTKLGRIATGSKPVRDNYVDGATYFSIAWECADDQE